MSSATILLIALKVNVVINIAVTNTCLYKCDTFPHPPPLLNLTSYSKTGVYRVYFIFLISAKNHWLWVLVRTALPRRF